MGTFVIMAGNPRLVMVKHCRVCVNRELDIKLCITVIPKHKAVAYNRGSR